MSQGPLLLLLLLLVTVVAIYLFSHEASLDFAGPLRDWFNARDAQKMAARKRFPDSLRRAYWSEREYQRDSQRLKLLGYVIASEAASDPYVTSPATPRRGPPMRRRVPVFYVIYEHRSSPDAGAEDARESGTGH
jgi:hypothetical protein